MSILPMILLLVAQATGPGPDRVVLTGSVVDPDGKPAVGVRIAIADDLPIFPVVGAAARASSIVNRPATVLRDGRTDAGGRFQVELPDPALMLSRLHRPFFVWAVGPGGSMAMRPIPQGWPADGEPVRIAMARPGPLRLLVLDPDDRPVGGVRLAPARIRGANLPDGLAGRLDVETDAQGRATLAVGAADEVEVVRAASTVFGMQRLRMPRAGEDGVRTIRLLPVGRLVGRVEAGDPSAVRGLAVRLRTDPDPGDHAARVGGLAAVVTDDQGRFAVPAIAAGTLALSIECRPELPWRGGMAGRPTIEPGSLVDVAIPLRRATRVTGVVRSVPEGRPVAGAGVAVMVGFEFDPPLIPTDGEGRYATYVAGPGVARAFVAVPPRGYCIQTQIVGNSRSLSGGVAEVTMDPIELGHGVDVRGLVVDAKGNPVAAAKVAGHCKFSIGTEEAIHSVSDREGRFRIADLLPGAKTQLSASRDEATTGAPTTFLAGGGPVTLTIGPEHAVAMIGRVKDPADRPIAGAAVRVSGRRIGARRGALAEQFIVALDDEGRTIVRTGPDGRFRTPRRLRPDLEYRIEAAAESFATAGSDWIAASDRAFHSFPPVVLHPLLTTRTVAGRVVDSGGRPVVGVVVFQSGDGPRRTRTTTDADGRFRLAGVYREPAFLFVEGDGLAFEGHRIGAQDGAIEVKVRRVGEPAGPPLHTLSPLLPRADELALARRMIGDDLKPLTEPASSRPARPLWHALPRVDIDRARNLLETHAIGRPSYEQSLRVECARVLSATDLGEATTIIDGLPHYLRSDFFRLASDALPATDRAGKLALLDRAIVQARAEPSSERKLVELGLIAYRLLDLGQSGRGTDLLREGQKLAATMPKLSAARGRFAAKLALIDVPAAIAMARESSPPGDDRRLLTVALSLANRDPAESERIFAGAQKRITNGLTFIWAAGRMARIDRERARRIAEAAPSPFHRIRALIALAASLAATDPKAAAALIDEVLHRLEKPEGADDEMLASRAAVEASHLLPTAERIDPELLRRCFWRTVALRPPRPASLDPTGLYENVISITAVTLARYDRTVARQVLGPAAARIRSIVDMGRGFRPATFFAAATAIDPTWAAALADSLPDDTPGAPSHPRADARQIIAAMLADEGPARWVYFGEYYLSQRVDSRDNE